VIGSRSISIADAPCFLKSAVSASRKSLLNDLREASNEPTGFPSGNSCPGSGVRWGPRLRFYWR
jgi:hypothetical protein